MKILKIITYLYKFILIVYLCSCGYFQKNIEYSTSNEINLDNDFEIHVSYIKHVGSVEETWWGDDLYEIELNIKNKSFLLKNLNFFQIEKDELNLKHSLVQIEDVYEGYKKNPKQFDMNSFFDISNDFNIEFFQSISFQQEQPIYDGRPVFREISLNEKIFYLAPFVGSYYGVPKRELDFIKDIHSSTGWIPSGKSKTIYLYFSLPKNSYPTKIHFSDTYYADLILNK